MKKQIVNNQLTFEKKSVAELNSNELKNVQGGSSPICFPQAVSQMTPAIVTSGLIGDESNAN
ncbi:class I lanthipeptide [Flavobacterium sp. GCM10027622]|uniref:class I lanthipeptide n=1 Tax=unclassified Flavobacterium TaxID=196869 RepID=UPI003620906E